MTDIQLPDFLTQQNTYQAVFVGGLKNMLADSDELGVFILVLANATYDANIYEQFNHNIKAKFDYFKILFQSSDDESTLGAPDDVAVFKKLMQMGLEQCGINQIRQEGDWLLQFNPLRSLRPARNSSAVIESINQSFNNEGFHFNKPFLIKEELWRGEIASKSCRILYNKFPFADFHALLVLDSQFEKKQWVEKQDLTFIWQLQSSLCNNMMISYNSIGAYASINHQHFQLSIDENKTSIGGRQWKHNGGDKDYPLTCLTALTVSEAWLVIEQLQNDNIAFNFHLKNGRIIVVPRLMQGQYQHSSWTVGFGWAEVCGLFYLASEESYLAMTYEDLEQELEKLKL